MLHPSLFSNLPPSLPHSFPLSLSPSLSPSVPPSFPPSLPHPLLPTIQPSSVDHTVTETLDMDSNPLYHLDPLTLPPRIRQQHEWPTITESAFSSNFSQSPRGRSLSYIQMQSAGHVFGAIVSSRSVDFTDSVIYDELDVHFVTRLPEAGSSL